MTELDRRSGILLHITSLPSPFGIGDLGPDAYRFVDFLVSARQGLWQVLPLNPTDPAHGNSPYSSSSAFAGSRLLTSPELLVQDGFLAPSDLQPIPPFAEDCVDYDAVRVYKNRLIDIAWEKFQRGGDRNDFSRFCEDEAAWLHDYALFVIIKPEQNGAMWSQWPEPLLDRHQAALDDVCPSFADCIARVKVEQYLFFMRWAQLKAYANSRAINIFGDIPIYVNYDSADTWSHTTLFKLDAHKHPTVVAGVPPDYFSKTGQLWGNPVYDWDALRETGYRWWIERLEHVFSLYDIARIDHFRGLVAYWEVPARHKTAQKGKWAPVPADDFFTTLCNHFEDLPVVAEDLGTITEDVVEVMKRYGFPGMKVLMFAFGEDNPKHPYLPENYSDDAVVYTGTHDNNTIVGWFAEEALPEDKQRFFEYLGGEIHREQVHWAMIRLALRSPADLAIIPMQDLLGLPASARMNTPATPQGNWTWRLTPEQLAAAPADELAHLVTLSGRAPA